MGCNCKKDNNGVEIKSTSTKKHKKKPLIAKAGLLVVKGFVFIFGSIVASVIVVPFSIYMLFKVIFFNEGIDVTDALVSIGGMLKKKDEDDDDDEEFEFSDEDEIVLMNAE